MRTVTSATLVFFPNKHPVGMDGCFDPKQIKKELNNLEARQNALESTVRASKMVLATLTATALGIAAWRNRESINLFVTENIRPIIDSVSNLLARLKFGK